MSSKQWCRCGHDRMMHWRPDGSSGCRLCDCSHYRSEIPPFCVGQIVCFRQDIRDGFWGPKERGKVIVIKADDSYGSGWAVEVHAVIKGFPNGYPKMSEYVDSAWLIPANS